MSFIDICYIYPSFLDINPDLYPVLNLFNIEAKTLVKQNQIDKKICLEEI